jgi:protein-disulfide isomerase
MRRPNSAFSGVWTAGTVLLVSLTACAKSPPEAQSASTTAKDGTGTVVPTAMAAPAAGGDDNTPPAGIDLSKLDEFQKKVFYRVVNKESSICGQAHSLLQSAKKDPSCRRSMNAVRYVVRLVEQGYTDSEVGEALAKRYRSSVPKAIDVAEAPVKGNVSAKVSLVEFADYECPHCKRLQSVLKQVMDEFRGEVKLYFKHYPLPQHTNARLAAEAAVAAQKQGKFWQFEEKLWANQENLTPSELEKFAKEVGLDVAKFRQDLEAPATKARVQKDRVDGGTLGLSSTPTLYINGREYTDPRDADSLREWIKEDLQK